MTRAREGPASPPVSVIVCGFMGSGNRLLCRMLRRHGLHTYQDHYCRQILRTVNECRERGRQPRALWPVRDLDAHRLSSLNYLTGGIEAYESEFAEHSRVTALALAEYAIPVLPVSYTRIVRNPDLVGGEIASWLGVPWLGWGEEIVDGDAKYRL